MAILVATVVGLRNMPEHLADGNQAIALLGNTIPTGAILVVLIMILGPRFRSAFQSGGDAGTCRGRANGAHVVFYRRSVGRGFDDGSQHVGEGFPR
jgi:hypothetical protein